MLSDDEQRSRYDQYGHAGLKNGGGGFGGFSSPEDIFGQFGDIFGDFFGGFGGGGRGRSSGGSRARGGEDLQYRLNIDFLEAVHGCEKKIKIPRRVHCGYCDGSGAKPGTNPRHAGPVMDRFCLSATDVLANPCYVSTCQVKEPSSQIHAIIAMGLAVFAKNTR